MTATSADTPKKILLMGDASNYHRTLAEGLRHRGHEVVVASDGTVWMNTERDVDLLRRSDSKLGGLELYLRLKWLLPRKLSGFDIVSVTGNDFISLRPARKEWLFNQLLQRNRKVFVTYLATESFGVEACLDPAFPLEYNEWRAYGKPTPFSTACPEQQRQWLEPALAHTSSHIFTHAEGCVSALYEYHLMAERILPPSKVAYGGIPINTRAISLAPIADNPHKLRILIGFPQKRKLEKGAERLIAAAQRVHAHHPDKCTLDIVSNISYSEFLQRLSMADIVLDQLYSYTPGTTALLAMAMGKVVVSGGEEAFYDFIGEKQLRPVVNALPDDSALELTIEQLVLTPAADLRARGLQGRDFVLRHNDVDVVTDRFLNFWKSRL